MGVQVSTIGMADYGEYFTIKYIGSNLKSIFLLSYTSLNMNTQFKFFTQDFILSKKNVNWVNFY